MSIMQTPDEREWLATADQHDPFAEAAPVAAGGAPLRNVGFASWAENETPFAETADGPAAEREQDLMLAKAFAGLRDEAFDEALAFLAAETEQAVADRFAGELPSSAQERERYADSLLGPVRFESLQYLDRLQSGLSGQDVESLSEEQLDEMLDRFDPETSDLTPAGEEFIGSLVRKAKSAVKVVTDAAKGVVGKVAGAALGPILEKLRGLINPLLKRVLSFAIGRLPAALQPAARTLAARFTSEAGAAAEEGFERPVSPANLTDVEALAESFDAALAEALVGGGTVDGSAIAHELVEVRDGEFAMEGRELETLAVARGALIDRLSNAQEDEDLAPAIEQFVPALLGALRLGINLVGRPKVVGFLARYVGDLIRRWVGPQVAGPLSNAIVDTGLRLISLEAEADGRLGGDEAGSVALASVIEDTVRRLAENEDYVYDNEDLMQLATADAFGRAVATHFPPQFVRSALQQAPSLGGTFVARRPRSVRTYRKYSRIPEIEVTTQIAAALPTFGGSNVGAALRAAGASFPMHARMHIYEAAPGTTLPQMMRVDRANGGRPGYAAASHVHPLTPAAAGLLLREPQLGVSVPSGYLRSRHRIAAGQRFYVLEPVGAVGTLTSLAGVSREVAQRLKPSRAWTSVNLRQSRITVGFYLSEADSQRIAAAIRQGAGAAALLQAMTAAYGAMESPTSPEGNVRMVSEDSEDLEELAAPLAKLAGRLLPPAALGQLRRRLRAWVLPALANWAKANAEAFARAAGHPDPGVTIRVRLTAVPGLNLLGQAVQGGIAAGALSALRGTPSISITVTPGRGRSKREPQQ